MAIFRAGPHHAGNRGHGRRLRGTTRPAIATARRRSLPHALAVVDAKREQSAALGRVQIIGAVVAGGLAVHFESDVGKSHVYVAAIGGRAPLDSTYGAAFSDARLP